MDMTFDQAMAEKAAREMMHDAKAIRLRAVSGEPGPMGLTPDSVKMTAEWQEAFHAERLAFAFMRRWNMYMAKHFKKELRAYYNQKRGN